MELDLAPISGRSLGCRSVAMGSNKDSGGIIQVSIMGGENMNSVQELDVMLATPSEALIEFIGRWKGDILILGVGGKMGPSLARRAQNAVMAAGVKKEIIGVSRFSEEASRQQLEDSGIHTIVADLMDEVQLQALPDVPNVIYMVGHKFGTTGREYYTWAMNTYLAGRVAEKYRHARIVAFSSGNVYPLSPVQRRGSLETDDVGPVGEYAQSCLGRERMLEHFSRKYQTPMLLYRLNYAIDMRYGVLHDVATAVLKGQPIDVTMGYANVIWQGDANDVALRSLEICDIPPKILNVTGAETISIRWLAEEFGRLLGKKSVIIGQEVGTALLNNASQCHEKFGYPEITLRQLIDWTATWVRTNGPTLNKPTHFQESQGRF